MQPYLTSAAVVYNFGCRVKNCPTRKRTKRPIDISVYYQSALKEIAELANVSVSTVSKVINKKDDNISSETRGRILDLVKKYHYSPYMDRTSENARPSLILGALVGRLADYGFLTGIVKRARACGYSTIVCTFSSSTEEIQNFQTLQAHHVDGIIWNKEHYSTLNIPIDILRSPIKTLILNSEKKPSSSNIYFSYTVMG